MNQEEMPQDPLADLLERVRGNAAVDELLEFIEMHYVYMACHTPGDPYTTAFREGQREMAAMICGVNTRIRDWQNKVTKGA